MADVDQIAYHDEVKNSIKATVKTFGLLDCVANIAGIAGQFP